MKKAPPRTELDRHLAALQSVSLRDVMTATALADFIGLPLRDVNASIEAGELPGRKVGEEWIVGRRALLAWLEHKKP